MTKEDLLEWARYHRVTFPSWKRCFAALSDEETKVAEGRLLRLFAGVTLEDAKAATDQVEAMEKKPPLDSHAFEVSRRARLLAMNRAANESGGASRGDVCANCRGFGFCSVFGGSLDRYMVLRTHPALGDNGVCSHRERAIELYAGTECPDFGLRQVVTIPCHCQMTRAKHPAKAIYDSFIYEWGEFWYREKSTGSWGIRRFENLSPQEQDRVLNGQ